MSDIHDLYEAVDATWPAAQMRALGPWTLREGRGGGKRVCAATTDSPVREADVSAAEDAMRAMSQSPLFMIREGQDAFDAVLERRGYRVVDPVNCYLGTLSDIAQSPAPRALVFAIWPPLEIQKDIWRRGGIGAARLDIMDRAEGKKTTIFGRHEQSAVGTGFVSLHREIAMLHAVEVLDGFRRLGVGRMMTLHAARWAKAHGAQRLAVLCTKANSGANALYASLGLEVVGQYHYRVCEEG